MRIARVMWLWRRIATMSEHVQPRRGYPNG
jgi:hypothetical protein